MDETSDTLAAMGQFNQTLIYERTAPVATLQGELTILAEFDKEAERQSKKWGWRLAFAFLGLIGSVVFTFVGASNESRPIWASASTMLVGSIILIVYFGKHYLNWSRRNIEDRRYQLLQELVSHLGCDVAPDMPLKVRLDGNDYHKPEYLSKDGDLEEQMSDAMSYRLPWLEVSGQLLDGHRFTVTATQLVKRKERRKRKYTKVKEAMRERVDVEMRCKKQKYPRWEELPTVARGLKLPLNLSSWTMRLQGDRVMLTGLMPRAVKVTGRSTTGSLDNGRTNSNTVLGLFVLLYRSLDGVRK